MNTDKHGSLLITPAPFADHTSGTLFNSTPFESWRMDFAGVPLTKSLGLLAEYGLDGYEERSVFIRVRVPAKWVCCGLLLLLQFVSRYIAAA